MKASPSPLVLDQLNQPPSMAVACVVAAANGQTTPVTDFGPRLAPAPPQSPDVGQLAFMEVGLDRSGKKVARCINIESPERLHSFISVYFPFLSSLTLLSVHRMVIECK